MKKFTVFFALFFVFTLSFSQITYTSSDLPNVGDTLRYSNASVTTNDPSLTGVNFTWDYSNLTHTTQGVDTFVNVLSTPFTYYLLFNNPLYPDHMASVAVKNSTLSGGAGITVTDGYDFFKESTSKYTHVGIASKINGIPTPAKYNKPELIYTFPFAYGNSPDSSYSVWSGSVPGLGYYGQTIDRKNYYEGWGTLTTPFGTFQVVKMKSIINTVDTLYYSALSFGTTIVRPTQTEYKWLAKNNGIPVLQITKSTVGMNIKYRDSLRLPTFSIKEINSKKLNFSVYPNPVTNYFKINYYLNDPAKVEIKLIDLTGRIVTEFANGNYSKGQNSFEFNNSKTNLSKGLYIIKLNVDDKSYYTKIIVN